MAHPPHPERRTHLRDRAITAVARVLSRAFFRSVETEGSEPPPGPVILAASHLYGFVDPVVLVARLGHLPRYLAKATLWKTAVARPLLNFARVIPVHRRADGATEDNAAMFADAVGALREGSMLAVFPEGTTHDDPSIRPLRTGVARIALQAAGSGVEGVRIVPVGVTYEDKVAVRGRALVSYGRPIEVPADPTALAGDGAPDPDRVHDLTRRLQSDIEALTPHFDTTEEALALSAAATVSLRDDAGEVVPVPMAAVAARARRLAAADPARRLELVSLVARYRMLLGFVDIDDEDVVRGIGLTALARRIAVLAAVVIVLAPLAVAGLFANLVPAVLVLVAGLVPKAPVSKGTVRLLVAAVTFPATWLFLALRDAASGPLSDLARSVTVPVDAVLGPDPADRAGFVAGLVVLIAVPVLGALALVIVERARTLVVSVVRWRTLLDRRGQLDEVRARRAEVVALTAELLDGTR
ncbi:MAG: 1-acyl-sn-glycerol-3-phosphate acyltransferase [Acidimicrobiales bacterium]|nr:1-acyl-sn-glycerol-3-phosphate acyltransferase [Acidimicrobiales bacterium]